MSIYMYFYLAGVATAIGVWVSYRVLKILLERDYMSYCCPLCDSDLASTTGFDRLTDLKIAAHKVFKRCSERSDIQAR